MLELGDTTQDVRDRLARRDHDPPNGRRDTIADAARDARDLLEEGRQALHVLTPLERQPMTPAGVILEQAAAHNLGLERAPLEA